MRIAVHTPFGLSEPIAETELFERLKIAATRLGWSCLRTDRSRAIPRLYEYPKNSLSVAQKRILVWA